MEKHVLVVDQPIFFTERNYRGNEEENIIETKIKTIGKKYFTVESADKQSLKYERFHIDTLRHDGRGYTGRYEGYLTKKEILDIREIKSGLDEIRNEIGNYGIPQSLSIDKVRAILTILRS